MNNIGTKRIESERLILRQFVLEDDKAMFNNWASDAEVTKYLTWPAHKSLDISKQVLRDWVNNYKNPDFYQWAIIVKDFSIEPIGSISVVHQDEEVGMAHIGYCIGRKFWHEGITSEALKMVINFLFDEVPVNRIESRHDPRNLNSGRVMKKCGMIYEGTLRQSDRNNQGICDASYYAILASDRLKI